jgi:hypothetical protein
MQLDGVLAQPAPPAAVVRSPGGDDIPEARPVTEDAEMRQLVDDDRFQRFRRREDQAP